jgi:hydrogenase nickel incorporation protein HypA/HybF
MDEHELASQVLAIVDEAAYRNAATRVSTVRLAIGGRRVLDLNRLQAVFAVAARGTVAEGAHLSVSVLPVRHRCQSCGNSFDASGTECPCPDCGNPRTEMMGGKELRLLDMEIADAA